MVVLRDGQLMNVNDECEMKESVCESEKCVSCDTSKMRKCKLINVSMDTSEI